MQNTAFLYNFNLRTLDTFHSMGIIAFSTPKTKMAKIIPRVKVTSEDITPVGKINITFLKPKCMISYQILQLGTKQKMQTFNGKHPGYRNMKGLLGMVICRWSVKDRAQEFLINFFMPMIDLKSIDEICIYSTLYFASE